MSNLIGATNSNAPDGQPGSRVASWDRLRKEVFEPGHLAPWLENGSGNGVYSYIYEERKQMVLDCRENYGEKLLLMDDHNFPTMSQMAIFMGN